MLWKCRSQIGLTFLHRATSIAKQGRRGSACASRVLKRLILSFYSQGTKMTYPIRPSAIVAVTALTRSIQSVLTFGLFVFFAVGTSSSVTGQGVNVSDLIKAPPDMPVYTLSAMSTTDRFGKPSVIINYERKTPGEEWFDCQV